MGSLTSGWSTSSPGVPPKDMQDYDDNEEQPGYFARLEASKTLRRRSERSDAGADGQPNFGNFGTLPLNPGRELASLPSRRFSRDLGSLSRISAPPTLEHSMSMPARAGDLLPPLSRHSRLERTSSLQTGKAAALLEPSSPTKRTGSTLDAYRIGSDTNKRAGVFEVQWWKKLSSGHLNDDEVRKAEGLEERPGTAGAPFEPQHHLTGQAMNFRASGGEAGSGAPQVQAPA